MKANLFTRSTNLPAAFLPTFSLVLIVGVMLAAPVVVIAGPQHARAVIGLGVQDRLAGHNGVAHATRNQGSKYRVAHEELGNNYTYGNAGSGHAHHHSGWHHVYAIPVLSEADQNAIPQREEIPAPVLGSRGTSQFIKQTWLAGAAANQIDVAWSRGSFLQIDPSELTAGSQIVSRASLKTRTLAGTVVLSARLGRNREPQFDTQLTGIFKELKFDLVTHPNGVVSLQFRDSLSWTVPGRMQSFDISLDASIDVRRVRG